MNIRYAAVAICFGLSGYAALLYQTAWMRQFAVVFGTSHLAVATVLAAYMGGLALGAYLIGRVIHRIRRPVLTYGLLEAGIALSALAIPILLMAVRAFQVMVIGGQPLPPSSSGLGQTTFYAGIAFVVLMLPTVFMGATLPLLTRYVVTRDREVGPRVGLLYGVNTAGAVLGAASAGFLLIPTLGLFGTVMVGVVTNILVFAIAVAIEKASAVVVPDHVSAPTERLKWDASARWMMFLIAVSGANAFYLEVLWTRLLNHVFGGTLIAFTTMLATFLTGIAIGGAAGGQVAKSRSHAAATFAVVQMLIAASSLVTYQFLDQLVPNTQGFAANIAFACVAMLPSTVLIGATFPLAVRVVAEDETRASAATANTYAWNTLGAIVGALAAGFVLIPALGFSASAKAAGILSFAVAGLCAVFVGRRSPKLAALSLVALVAAAVFYDAPRPTQLLRALADDADGSATEIYYGVGKSATILVHDVNGVYQMRSDGLPESTIYRLGSPPSKHSQYWLTALPSVARPAANQLLMIGLGGGVALEVVPPNIESIDVIELEREVIAANETLSKLRNRDPLDDPRVNIVLNDARSALALTSKQYDIIVSQPSHPWTAGASHLYTMEFLRLARSRLTDNGVFLQWINAQYIDESLLRTLTATVTEVFANVRIYQPLPNVLLFLASDAAIDVEQQAMILGEPFATYSDHYRRIGMGSVEDMIAALVVDESGTANLARGASPNSDNFNRLATDSRQKGDGFTAERLHEFFADHDVLLTAPDKRFRTDFGDVDYAYVATQLVQTRFERRAFGLARSLTDPSMRDTIDGIGFMAFGQVEQAQAAFVRAVDIDPNNPAASFSLVKPYLSEIGADVTYARIENAASRLPASAQVVVAAWQAGSGGDWARLQALDEQLANIEPTQLWYPIGVKLRADWRLAAARQSGDPALGQEALGILDDVLAFYWNFDLYVQRAASAFIAGMPNEFLESSWWAAQLIRSRIDKARQGRYRFAANEYRATSQRLNGLAREVERSLDQATGARAADVLQYLNETRQQLDDVVKR